MFDQIEKLKTDLTDKYVLVDATIPELARFEGHVGQVKTVNMNGRALVQFDTWNNIGWYDIDVDCLRRAPRGAATAGSVGVLQLNDRVEHLGLDLQLHLVLLQRRPVDQERVLDALAEGRDLGQLQVDVVARQDREIA